MKKKERPSLIILTHRTFYYQKVTFIIKLIKKKRDTEREILIKRISIQL